MGKEIERRFLVRGNGWRQGSRCIPFSQGFLSTVRERVVRVRIAGSEATLTIKGATRGLTKPEFEYPIPLDDARILLEQLCERPLIEKDRYFLHCNGCDWVVDEFAGENRGLIIAEVELSSEDQVVILPDWVGEEVSHDARYFNANLVHNPFCLWGEKNRD